ncbi:para-aminobenzoate synthase, (PABA) [Coemansia sp. RSA 1813]|nr:para-aminobenzoate synthase, (PABA) [Coemansia sp. RSA 1646]KAJ2086559.1 para-aminobenzoate synthase, (PABA) [Coemansia sp. RSA 986]KAJ2211218.1 para-aminobenzoate synthase, (PABA) [Coemansia sp. RSA 487]KAJ2565049.1 para-aminobenzoate synthase, (PABA) [Coemansia sp. RSA 1813]
MPYISEDKRSLQPRTLLVDNYDSYTFNLLQLLVQQQQTGTHVYKQDSRVLTIRNDQYPWPVVRDQILPHIDNIVISPGPGTPGRAGDFGICDELIRYAAETRCPLLGVCLGHQGIARLYGAHIYQCAVPVHGQTTHVIHMDGSKEGSLFAGVPERFTVVRYHSLAVSTTGFPHDELQVLACATGTVATLGLAGQLEDVQTNEIMALRHKRYPIFGVQFHPESIASEYGAQILANFTNITREFLTKKASEMGIQKSVAQMSIVYANKPTGRPVASEKKSHYSLATATVDLPGFPVDNLGGRLQKFLYGNDPMPLWLDSAKSGDANSSQSVLASAASAHGATVRYNLQTKKVTVLRFSELSTQPTVLATETIGISFWEWMQQAVDCTRVIEAPTHGFRCGWIGYFAYEMKAEIIGTKQSAISNEGEKGLPDAQLSFVDRCVVIDHKHNPPKAHILAIVAKDSSPSGAESHGISRRWMDSLGFANKAGADQWIDQTVRSIEQWLESAITTERKDNNKKLIDGEMTVLLEPALSRANYIAAIDQAKKYIAQGESYEICLTNKFRIALPEQSRISCAHDASKLYTEMRASNPAPYGALLWYADLCAGIASCSPERFLRITVDSNGNRLAEMKPIKGTVRRPERLQYLSEEEWAVHDTQSAKALQESVKERAENLMIVDLIRHDLNAISGGCTSVPRLMAIESYQHVHQMVTTVEAQMNGTVGDVMALAQCFPPGSMTGAPKIRTVRLIEKLENHVQRNVYSGCLGYFSTNGQADWSVVIRTAVISGPDELCVGAGGALTILSNPDEEWAEVETKLCSVLPAIQHYVNAN